MVVLWYEHHIFPLPCAPAARPASADPADVRLAACGAPLSASPILVMDCLEVGAVVPIVAKLDAVVTIYLAEDPPRRLHGDAAFRDTS